jgi:hypothetical protein
MKAGTKKHYYPRPAWLHSLQHRHLHYCSVGARARQGCPWQAPIDSMQFCSTAYRPTHARNQNTGAENQRSCITAAHAAASQQNTGRHLSPHMYMHAGTKQTITQGQPGCITAAQAFALLQCGLKSTPTEYKKAHLQQDRGGKPLSTVLHSSVRHNNVLMSSQVTTQSTATQGQPVSASLQHRPLHCCSQGGHMGMAKCQDCFPGPSETACKEPAQGQHKASATASLQR